MIKHIKSDQNSDQEVSKKKIKYTPANQLKQANLPISTHSKYGIQSDLPPSTQQQRRQTGIPSSVQTKFENRSGLSFNDVKVHYNSDKPIQLQALAYTKGNQVYIGPGQEKHLEHELGHVVQQKQGRVRANKNLNGVPLNTEAALEKEAESFNTLTSSALNLKNVQNDAIQLKAMSPGDGVVQRVLFTDIPINDDNENDYKAIEDMQVWWFMACERNAQGENFDPAKHLKSLRNVRRGGFGYEVDADDTVRLACHGNEASQVKIGEELVGASEIVDAIKNGELGREGNLDRNVEVDFCHMGSSGVDIYRGNKKCNVSNEGVTVSGVDNTLILPTFDQKEEFSEARWEKMERPNSEFDNAMIHGIRYKKVNETAKEDFSELHIYLDNINAGDSGSIEKEQLNIILDQVYSKGTECMNQFTNCLDKIDEANGGKNIQKIPNIWNSKHS